MAQSSPRAQDFVSGRMRQFAKGAMRSGVGGIPGRRGTVVSKPKQAAAIALSEARGKGMKVPARPANPSPSFWGATAKGSPPGGAPPQGANAQAPGARARPAPGPSGVGGIGKAGGARARIFGLLSRAPR